MSWLEQHADVECCDIVTIGRVSGDPHELEIWFGVMDGLMYLISGNGTGADWYRNLLANPDVVVKLAGEEHVGHARTVDDPDERRACGRLMGSKYEWDGDPSIGLSYDAWCHDVPAVAIEFPRLDLRE